METRALIEFKDVSKRFDARVVLDGVNLKIFDGHVTTIIGKSGTGKSVLLKHIIGLLKPDKGQILYWGVPISEMRRGAWDEYIGRISYMFQNNALFDSMTVFENIALPLRQTTNLSAQEIKGKVLFRIEQTELVDAANKYPAELSGGMQKRVALARALVTDPSIVLFDEPTTGQDPIRRNAIMSMIAEYQQKVGFTAVLVSHDLPDVFFISNRVLVLDGGKIVFQGSPEELDQFEHPFVDELIGSLEGFQERLTGLYSKRSFKVRYQTALRRRHATETFTVVTVTIDQLDLVTQHLGHEKAQVVIKALGEYINKHFAGVGGVSTRTARNLFVTVLPYSDLEEAHEILRDFRQDLEEHGLLQIGDQAQMTGGSCFEFFVFAGVAQGRTNQDIESIMATSESTRKAVAHFRCHTEGETE